MIRANNSLLEEEIQPDLTPLLDIIFIVMVFLLLTASVRLQSLEVDLPQTETKTLQETEADPVTINLASASPYWALQSAPIESWNEFTQALIKEMKKNPQRPVVIGADKAGSVEHMLKLLAFLQQHDIKATQLLMEEEES
ncbi:Biopolymer transport protein ExbD1 [Photobacterium marinum]|uniref:Biopolymer transport protein ExbD1 n=1 Tax=Photobacterium marinum TaxID=1056511 RepID=L8JJX6_9GAMM|nr:biopolymer transporter ExbD [Photobacterium marinum]ELR67727.1 Biopolymer transport protein ExbD1 [Photobacterium marinum]